MIIILQFQEINCFTSIYAVFQPQIPSKALRMSSGSTGNIGYHQYRQTQKLNVPGVYIRETTPYPSVPSVVEYGSITCST